VSSPLQIDENGAASLLGGKYARLEGEHTKKLTAAEVTELQKIVELKNKNQPYDQSRHKEILSMLKYAANSFDLKVPNHWL
jgi:hypothetical protein